MPKLVLVVFGVPLWLGWWFAPAIVCPNRLVAVAWSPDGRHKAIVFERSCGATTSFSTQVSILSWWNIYSARPGNTFIATTDHGLAPAAKWGGPEVNVEWRGPADLVLKYDPRADVFLRANRVRGVTITFASFDEASNHAVQPTQGAPQCDLDCSTPPLRALGG